MRLDAGGRARSGEALWGGGGGGAACGGDDDLAVGPAWPSVEAPPIAPGVARDLYGHLTEGEIDAQAAARKQEVTESLATHDGSLGIQAAPPVGVATVPQRSNPDTVAVAGPTIEGLEAELAATLDKELADLDESQAKALADLDVRIEEQRALLDEGVLGAGATDAAEEALNAQASEQQGALGRQGREAAEAQAQRAVELGRQSREQAEASAASLESEASATAGRLIADGATRSMQVRLSALAEIQAAQGAIAAAAAEMVSPDAAVAARAQASYSQAAAKVATLRANSEALAQAASSKANTEAERHLAEARRQARALREGAKDLGASRDRAAAGETAAAERGGAAIEAQRQAGKDKLRAGADATRARQRDQAATTLAALEQQRQGVAAHLAQQVAAKRATVQARIDGLRRQVKAAGPDGLKLVAAQVKLASGEIDSTSDALDVDAVKEADAFEQRIAARTEKARAVMKTQSDAALAQIDADAAAAKAALGEASRQAAAELGDATRAGDAGLSQDADAAAQGQREQADAARAGLVAGAAGATEAVAQAGMSLAERQARRKELAAREALKAEKTGDAKVDKARLERAIADLPPDVRAEVIADLPEGDRQIAEDAARWQGEGERLRANPEAAADLLAGWPVAERNKIIAASGLGDALGDEHKRLGDDERDAAVDAITRSVAQGQMDPDAMKASFDELTPLQQAQIAQAYEARTGRPLEADLPAELLPDAALTVEARTAKAMTGIGMDALARARTGNEEVDNVLLRQGLAVLPSDKLDEALASLPPEQRAMGERLARALPDVAKIRACGGDPQTLEAIMAGKSPEERQAIISMAGGGEELARYGGMSAAEASAAAGALRGGARPGGKLDPTAVKAAFAGLSHEQRAILAAELEAQTGAKLEEQIPADALPNELLSVQGLLAKKPDDPARLRGWLETLPADRRDAAVAELAPEEQARARAIATGEQLHDIVRPIDGDLSPEERRDAKAAQDKAVAALLKGKSAAERNAILAEAGVKVDETYEKLSGEETRLAVEAMRAAKDDPAAVKALFQGLTPQQAAVIAREYEAQTGNLPEKDLPAGALPAAALSAEARGARSPDEIAASLSELPRSGDPQVDAAALHANLKAIPPEKLGDAIAGLPPAMRDQAILLCGMSADGEALAAAAAAGDVARMDELMAGRTPAERRAILATSGAAAMLPDSRRYGELTEEEKEAEAIALRGALVGGVDTVIVDQVMGELAPDQQRQTARAYKERYGERLGDAFKAAGNEAALPEELREQEGKIEDAREAAGALMKAMDGMATGENVILDTLRGKSPREIAAIEEEYAKLHGGHSLRDDLLEDMDEDSEEYKAAIAMMNDDPAEAALQSLIFAGDGTGTDEQLIKDTLASLTDPADRAAFEELWRRRQPDGFPSLDAWLDDELGESRREDNTDRQEVDALRSGDYARARAVRLYDAFEGAGTVEEKVWAELEACPDEKSRRKLREEFRAVAAMNGVDPELVDLDAMMADELESDAELAVAQHLARGELAEAYAAKLEVAASGWGTTEETFFTTFENPPPGWKGDRKAWREAVAAAHDAAYETPLAELAADELSAKDTKRFEQTLADGKMDPNFAMYYATDGLGTKDAVLRKLLFDDKGKMLSKEELAARRKSWRESEYYDGTDFDELVREETSGRLGFDLEEALEGEPTTPEERLGRLRRRAEFENSGLFDFVTDAFTQSDDFVEAQLAAAEKAYADSTDPSRTEAERARALAEFHERDQLMETNTGEHRAAMDAIADKFATVGKFLGGPLGAFAAKLLVKGGQMEVEDGIYDLTAGTVKEGLKAALAAVTAGAGAVAAEGASLAAQAIELATALPLEALKMFGENALDQLLDPRFLDGTMGVGEAFVGATRATGVGLAGHVAGGVAGEVAGGATSAVVGAHAEGEDPKDVDPVELATDLLLG